MSSATAAGMSVAVAPVARAKRMLVGASVISGGLAVEYGSQMVRMLILARILGPAEFGIVVSLNAVYAIVGMSTSIGIDRFIIHVADGNRRHWLDVSHTLSFAQAGVNAVLLLLLAWPTTRLLDSPQALGSFLALALVPLLAAPSHMRPVQIQRRHVFWPDTAAGIVGNLSGLVAAVIAAFTLHDHRALIVSLCTASAVKTVATHLVTRVRYRLSVDRAGLRAALRFGLPLMANGLALALLSQLDRIVVGAFLGLADLGRYGLAMTIVLTPISLLLRIGYMIFQPQLSSVWHQQGAVAFWRSTRRVVAIFAFIAALFALNVALLGDILLPTLFGTRFAVGDLFMALLSAIALTRFAKSISNLASLATGHTTDLMLSNGAGTIGVIPAVVCLSIWPCLPVAAAGYLVSELLATVVIIVRLEWRAKGQVERSPFYDFILATPILAGVIGWVFLFRPTWPARVGLGSTLLLIAAAIAVRMASPLRKQPEPVPILAAPGD